MSTFLDLKTAVTGQLGGLDASTYVAKRDNCINRARRRYYSEASWQYLGANDYILNFTNGIALLPIDFNVKFSPQDLYFYAGNIKYVFNRTEWGSIPSYLTDQYVYSIDKGTARQIKTNHPEIATLSLSYNVLPSDYTATDSSQDSLTEAAPDITAIELLAVGYWWLSKERDFEKFQYFENLYKEKLKADLKEDESTNPVKYFRPIRPYVIRGYISRQ